MCVKRSYYTIGPIYLGNDAGGFESIKSSIVLLPDWSMKYEYSLGHVTYKIKSFPRLRKTDVSGTIWSTTDHIYYKLIIYKCTLAFGLCLKLIIFEYIAEGINVNNYSVCMYEWMIGVLGHDSAL